MSEIAKPPASRKPIVTRWVDGGARVRGVHAAATHLDAGRQAYVVCPLIEESETSQARAAEEEAERLRRAELRELRVGCCTGGCRPAERRELMARFKARELDVLVATTVIEVGVDVPNATIMIVQEADRFGLAQLHQLRGRVGRGAEQSYCLLVSRPKEELTDDAQARLAGARATRPTASSSPRSTSSCAARASCSARASRASPTSASRAAADRPLLERARARDARSDDGPLADEVERLFGDGRA